jgi:hypothetical protein
MNAEKCFDIINYFQILNGDGDWFNARLLRALHDLLPHADDFNGARLRMAFPKQCRLVEKAYNVAPVNWPQAVKDDPEFEDLIQ